MKSLWCLWSLLLCMVFLQPLSLRSEETNLETLKKFEERDPQSLSADEAISYLDKSLNQDRPSTLVGTIKTWNSLSHRYAVGLNEKGEPVAITDLAMENHKSLSYIKRTLLGAIGFGDLNLKNLIAFLKWIWGYGGSPDLLMADQLGEVGPLADLKNFKFPKELRKITKADDRDEMVKKLEKWEKKYGERPLGPPEKWWSKIIWNNPQMALLPEGPSEFRLSDINLERTARFPRLLRKILGKFTNLCAQSFEIPLSSNLLDHFVFSKNEKGEYEYYFDHLPESLRKELAANPDLAKTLPSSRYDPVIVADIAHPTPSIWKPIGIFALKTVLGQIVNLIPNQVVSALIGHAIDRWFRLYKEQWTAHRVGVLEGLNLIQVGHTISPFTTLDKRARERAALDIVREEVGIWGILKRFFRRPSITTWKNDIRKDQATTRTATRWLTSHNYVVSEINPWFATGTNGDNKKIFMLADHWPFFKKPFVGVDYAHPNREYVFRHLSEVFDFALDFLNLPIPFADFILKQLYNFFVLNPIEDSKEWEARLSSYLFYRHDRAGENWDREINHLYRIRLNPFELNRAEEEEMITERRKRLNLP